MEPKLTSYKIRDVEDRKREDVEIKGENERNSRCGFFDYRPAWMQCFNNLKFLLILICGFTFIQSFAVNGINNANTTSYERRFGLPSSRVGFIASSYDIAAGIVIIPISYVTSNLNKHVVLGVAAGTLSLGFFVMTLPHFITDTYHWGDSVQDICFSGNITDGCVGTSENLSHYLYALIAGTLLLGTGGCTLNVLGVVCLDDGASTKSAPTYVSIMYCFSALGLASGYLLGGYFLESYVDFDTLTSAPLESNDPRWVGAWWLGFLVATVVSFLFVFPFLALPRQITVPEDAKSKQDNISVDLDENKNTKTISLKEFPKAIRDLFKNAMFILMTLAGSVEYMFVGGMTTFASKYLQNQFGQTPGSSAILAGVAIVPGAAGGFLLGGFICRRFNLSPVGLARGSALCSAVGLLLSPILWSKCDGNKFAGITVDYNNSLTVPTFPSVLDNCNSECGCSQSDYAPVCGSDGIQYFSPCHAGCTLQMDKYYTDCSCINSTLTTNQTARPGVCESTCPLLYVFVPVFFGIVLSTCTPAVLTTMATIRIVPASMKTFAFGVQWVPLRFLGLVPGPILLGAIIDRACIVWEKSCSTKENESCWIYDNGTFSRNIFFAVAGIKLASCCLFFAASLVYKPLKEETLDMETDSTYTNVSLSTSPSENVSIFKIEPAAT